MTFLHPLLAICAVAIVPASYVAQRASNRSRGHVTLAYSNLDFLTTALRAPAWPAIALDAARAGAVALLLLAAAGPRLPVTLFVRNAAIVICMDTSGSMRTADVRPTREAAALRAVRAFLAAIPSATKIGVVSFAGSAQILTTPSADREAVREALAAMPAPNGQTALGDGLRAALRMLPAAGKRAIVLLTDGVNNRGEDPAQVLRDLQAAHVALYAIGVGENAVAGRALRSYASGTGGSYARVDDAAQFSGEFARISAAAMHRRQTRDVSEVPALAGLFLLAAAWLASNWAGRLSYLGEPELHEPLGDRDDASQLRRAARDGDRRRAYRVSARLD